MLLSGIAPDYPNFYDWLGKNFTKSEVSKKVVVIGKAIAAFSMWQYKDERNVKLQTFVVGPQFRGTAIGQHLLYHEILTWANDPKVERVFVTVASSKSELIGYFRTFGFRVEGIAANRYPRASDAAELVMAKHFVREVVRTPDDLERVSKGLVRRVWGIDSVDASRFGVSSHDLAVPAFFPKVKINVELSETTIAPRLKLTTKKGRNLLTYDDESLMREFLPLRIHLRRKRFVIIPIYPQWVAAMLSKSGPETPLKLRVANVYYCYPKLGDLTRGNLVLFYETKKGGGRGATIGAAVIQEVLIDNPAKLHAKFSDLGIYQLNDIRGHIHKATGWAMAIKFALFEHFLKPVGLAKIQSILGHHATMQGLTPVSREGFEKIRNKGLSLTP